jgi:hypothetical protein
METLFPLHDVVPQPAQAGHVTWSFSKRQLLFQCPRKFYYHYYGASSRTAHGEPNKARLRELKPITNLDLRAGDIVDLVIRTYLSRADANSTWDLTRLQKWGLAILEKDRAFNLGVNLESSREFVPPRLLEFVASFPDRDSRYEAAEQKILVGLKNFAESEAYAPFRKTGKALKTQQNITVTVDGSLAKGKIDLELSEPECHHILDWKIGSAGSADENLQVGFYGLWASKQSTIQIPIKLHMAYLADGIARTYCVPDDVHPRQVRARITQDLILMRNLHPYGTAANARAFTPCRQNRICEMCQYQSVCSAE